MKMSGLILKIAVFLSILIGCFVESASVGCRDNDNKPVDWFVVYKFPRITKNTDKLIANGVGHVYMDGKSKTWTLNDHGIDETEGHAVYYTLQQIYDSAKSKNLAYLMYNDQLPDETDNRRAKRSSRDDDDVHVPDEVDGKHVNFNEEGHTKGDVAFDHESGFWLVHSVPHFSAPAKYLYPHSGTFYGQTFLCVTYGYKYFNVIGKQLLYNHPKIYQSHLPDSFKENDNIESAIKFERIEAAPWTNIEKMESLGGQSFISFAKAAEVDQDLYEDLVAPALKVPLKVESWIRGHKIENNCNAHYPVVNVQKMEISGVAFNEGFDHSKWALSDKNSKYICIGDINRMTSQKKRHGGTVCSKLPAVWKAFSDSIAAMEPCPHGGEL